MIRKLRAEEILNAFGLMKPRVLSKERAADMLQRGSIRLAMQAVAIFLVPVITHRRRHLEKLEKPMVVNGKRE